MRLTSREKRLSLIMIIFIAAWISYALLVKPARARLETLQRVIPEKASLLQDLKAKSHEYLALSQSLNTLQTQVSSQPPDFNLLSYLESLTNKLNLTDNVVTMQPQTQPLADVYNETIVILELKDIALKQLIDLLSRLSSASAPLRVRNLNLDKDPASPQLLDTTLHISHLTLK